ncbi:MAG: exodeoxyribonuclease III [Kiritimatiellia bacterium]
MKIATFNVNSIRSRMEAVLDWLGENSPDLLCIQETKVQDHEFPALPFRQAGYYVVFKGGKSYSGVALLSKYRPERVSFGLDDGKDADESRLLYAKAGPVHVVNTYVPQGRAVDHPMYRYKLQWFKRLRAYFQRRLSPRARVVWVGDLNVAPDPIDIHNPEKQENHVCYHKSVRKAFKRVMEWGFVDVFRKHHPEAGQYTYFDYRTRDAVKRGMGWRVDHVLATRSLARRSKDSFIDLKPRLQKHASDHTVLAAEFDI